MKNKTKCDILVALNNAIEASKNLEAKYGRNAEIKNLNSILLDAINVVYQDYLGFDVTTGKFNK